MADYAVSKRGRYAQLIGTTDVQEVSGLEQEYNRRLSLTMDASSTAGAITFSKPLTFSDSLTISGVTPTLSAVFTFADSVNVTGVFKPTGKITTRATSAVSTNQNLTAADSGKVYILSGDTAGVVMTLPSTVDGLSYTFVLQSLGATSTMQIKPAAADVIQANNANTTVPAVKDALELKGDDTSNEPGRDSLTLVGDGSNGWYAQSQAGEWKRNTNPS